MYFKSTLSALLKSKSKSNSKLIQDMDEIRRTILTYHVLKYLLNMNIGLGGGLVEIEALISSVCLGLLGRNLSLGFHFKDNTSFLQRNLQTYFQKKINKSTNQQIQNAGSNSTIVTATTATAIIATTTTTTITTTTTDPANHSDYDKKPQNFVWCLGGVCDCWNHYDGCCRKQLSFR